ncbi:hypothetical protein [Bifidobacterium sp. UBA4282]|uniref:hypothetical protein n=1 Tax=Bifidobacterium sp. UBA4282 TaxID=1946096 RepID=UPI0025BF45DA|nr:hypothetical protein [Bifidobacterium sp. UBA4282]
MSGDKRTHARTDGKREPGPLLQAAHRVILRIVRPGSVVTVVSVIAGTVLLALAFMVLDDDHPLSIVAYVVSAYALVVVVARIVSLARRGNELLRRNIYVRRLQDDLPFRLRLSLLGSLAINLLYSAMNALSGFYYHSVWFGMLAAYYIMLSVMRFSLVRYARTHGFGRNTDAELRRYRLCGIVLVALNVVLIGLVVLVLHDDGGFEYAGTLIYVMALYSFYSMTLAIINVVRYRRLASPAIAASGHVNLVSALVSMFSLEIAMLGEFGDGGNSAYFRPLMIALSGAAICGFVTILGAYMIVRATRRLRAGVSGRTG